MDGPCQWSPMRDMLAPMIIRAVAHVGLPDISDQTQGRSGHVKRTEGQCPGLGQRSSTV